ncbi:hypothetical protein T265_00282 [Opisthorchis viverrini]|uniref:Uncharacterized protein n=1 Tax=Opisthorchis viverrini TaxID=6198 RepID=A0A075ACU3_OPIVI|nr:hypothetical protein T265_00282 [Opisthorchis viverrini]KER33825.1 hypothetical protein T265_00282 [Opisthorchis viverrini]
MQSLSTPIVIPGETIEVVERFTCLGRCISSDCSDKGGQRTRWSTSCFVVWLWDLACSSSGTETSSGIQQSLSQDNSLCELLWENLKREANVAGYPGVGIVLSELAEASLIEHKPPRGQAKRC